MEKNLLRMAVETRKKRLINNLILTNTYKYDRNELHHLTLTELEQEWERCRHFNSEVQFKSHH
ncbi:Fur-regulated basic protein FbpA [Scopulibacillus cellulosilyticus]|uniref:Fur-regulated basic protein FbpA n=1 Tax=Scopulibacillus cellulosilyticus TaxID=2665665 RepID=A0ABW2PZ24_9BACL